MSTTENDVVKGIRSEYQYGFSNPDEAKDYFFKSGRGLSHEVVEAIAEHKNEPEWMRAFRHKALDYFYARPLPDLGRQRRRDRLREHLLLHQADREAGRQVGGPARRDPRHLGQARHPRGGEEVPRRRRCPVRVRSRLPQAAGGSRAQGRDLPRHGLRAPRAPGHRQAVHRHDHPGERQQVRRAQLGRLVGRIVHLRAARRAHRDAAAGLLPHQRREHGPVRADADHRRRRRLRALRRGLHGADLLVRLPALGGRRDHRQAARPLPLHDDPELVEQRLQPRHQAGRRPRGRDDGVGRRQPRRRS